MENPPAINIITHIIHHPCLRTHCFTALCCSGLCLKRETKNGDCNLQITFSNASQHIRKHHIHLPPCHHLLPCALKMCDTWRKVNTNLQLLSLTSPLQSTRFCFRFSAAKSLKSTEPRVLSLLHLPPSSIIYFFPPPHWPTGAISTSSSRGHAPPAPGGPHCGIIKTESQPSRLPHRAPVGGILTE